MKVLAIIAALAFTVNAHALTVDKKNSEVKWTGTKVTGKHYGKVPIKEVKLVTDKENKLQSGKIVLEIAKFTVEDLSGKWKQKFLDHMKSEDFFETKKWKTAKFEFDQATDKELIGKLFIKDKSEPIKVPYTEKNGVYSGTFTFDRTKFGMIYGSGDFFKNLGDKLVHNDVKIEFRIKTKP